MSLHIHEPTEHGLATRLFRTFDFQLPILCFALVRVNLGLWQYARQDTSGPEHYGLAVQVSSDQSDHRVRGTTVVFGIRRSCVGLLVEASVVLFRGVEPNYLCL